MSKAADRKIYHIVHIDRLPSIIADGCLWCDAEIVRRSPSGTTIGMTAIKRRRLYELTLTSHPHLHVGDCVPFYFCPRSVMLYLIHQGNHPELDYRGGQGPIVHLEANLQEAVDNLKEAVELYLEDENFPDLYHEVAETMLGETSINA